MNVFIKVCIQSYILVQGVFRVYTDLNLGEKKKDPNKFVPRKKIPSAPSSRTGGSLLIFITHGST